MKPAKNTAKKVPVETQIVTEPVKAVELEVVLESARPIMELVALVGTDGRAITELSATEYATLITEKIKAATMGIRHAALLGYQASTEGKFQKVLTLLENSGEFAQQTIHQLKQTVERVFPFILDQGGNPINVKNLDAMRELMPRVALLDKETGKFDVVPEHKDVVKRALAGESPRALVNELKAAAHDGKSGGGGISFAARAHNLGASVKTKSDISSLVLVLANAAAKLDYALPEITEKLDSAYSKASAAKLEREQREEDAKEKAEAKKQDKKAKLEAAKEAKKK